MSAKGISVVLYQYDASPFAQKVKNMLTLKRIPHKRVNVGMTMPRPELSDHLGVTYRKIPVLAIGNDVYCDTSLIAPALEKRFPASQGYGTLFPPRVGGGKADTGLALVLKMYWSDRTVFPLAVTGIPWKKFPQEFLDDRASWQGHAINVDALVAAQPAAASAVASHLHLVEQQLSDGREWLLDTTHPGLVDLSGHFVFNWMRYFKSMKVVYDPEAIPKTISWLDRMNEYIKKGENEGVAAFETVSAEEGAKIISSSYDPAPLTFDEKDAARIGVELGATVSVRPADNGKIPTTGKLVGLDREEVVVETSGTAGVVRVHFPRLNFSIKPESSAKL